MQVLEQVSPNISEVICKSANENRDRNRRTDYLPCESRLSGVAVFIPVRVALSTTMRLRGVVERKDPTSATP